MIINQAKYLGSFPSAKACPVFSVPEYAFVGRSNVGKSSLINLICQRKELARVSNTPGKTQSINLYEIEQEMDSRRSSWLRVCQSVEIAQGRVVRNDKRVFVEQEESRACLCPSGPQVAIAKHRQ